MLFGCGVAFAQVEVHVCDCVDPDLNLSLYCGPTQSGCCACGTARSEAICCNPPKGANCTTVQGPNGTLGSAKCI